jgi:asparagine synthase (glutamine-hydrolysing)
VALSGDGGDELFAGYTKYSRLALRDSVSAKLPMPIRRTIAVAAETLDERSDVRRTLLQHTLHDAEMFTDTFTLGFTSGELRQAARGPLADCLKHYSSRDTVVALMRRAPPEHVGVINTMRYLDLKLTLAGDILVKLDRASMAVSLEVRPVYLHRDVLSLAARIPPRLLAGRRRAKRLLKDALGPWLPPEVLHRRKMGFAMPLGSWIRANGNGSRDRRPHHGLVGEFLNPELGDRLHRTHMSGRIDHTARLHSLDFLDRWMGLWMS